MTINIQIHIDIRFQSFETFYFLFTKQYTIYIWRIFQLRLVNFKINFKNTYF